MPHPILAPAAVLACWSMVVLAWVTVARFAAIARLPRERLRAIGGPGTRGADLEGVLPPSANWPSHNYTHLMEQPTVFYAAVVVLALAGAASGFDVALAWAYAGLRIVHSLWQGTLNRLPPRMLLFSLSSLCLGALTVDAVRATL
jgi:uncharacterized MAPEG superfamily protein